VPKADPLPTLATFAARWLHETAPLVRATTLRNYRWALSHLLPRLGDRPLDAITRADVLHLMPSLIANGLRPGSARLVVVVLRAVLSVAVDEELLARNPAANFGRRLRRVMGVRHAPVTKALTPAQTAQLLAQIARDWPHLTPLFVFLARTGCRISEALALQWDAVDLEQGIALIARSWHDRGVSQDDVTKTTSSVRLVDLSPQLVTTLRRQRLATGRSVWVFPSTRRDEPWHRSWIEGVMKRALRAADLPAHLTPHSLRHSWASTLLRRGEPLAYVSRGLGHTSVSLTLGLYGAHLPNSRPGAVGGLDTDE
jgi:integrase